MSLFVIITLVVIALLLIVYGVFMYKDNVKKKKEVPQSLYGSKMYYSINDGLFEMVHEHLLKDLSHQFPDKRIYRSFFLDSWNVMIGSELVFSYRLIEKGNILRIRYLLESEHEENVLYARDLITQYKFLVDGKKKKTS